MNTAIRRSATPDRSGLDAAKRYLSWDEDRQDRLLASLDETQRIDLLYFAAQSVAPRYEGKGRACPEGCTCGRHNWRERL